MTNKIFYVIDYMKHPKGDGYLVRCVDAQSGIAARIQIMSIDESVIKFRPILNQYHNPSSPRMKKLVTVSQLVLTQNQGYPTTFNVVSHSKVDVPFVSMALKTLEPLSSDVKLLTGVLSNVNLSSDYHNAVLTTRSGVNVHLVERNQLIGDMKNTALELCLSIPDNVASLVVAYKPKRSILARESSSLLVNSIRHVDKSLVV